MPLRLISILLASITFTLAGPSDPEPVAEASWMRAIATQKQALDQPSVDLCFVGDSLTEFWTATGKPIWDLEFHDRTCVNLGLAGDRTEHILFRLSRFSFAKAKPRTFILLAGTNNLSKDPPDAPAEVAAAVIRIAAVLKTKSPEARVFVLSILPNGNIPDTPLRKSIVETNRVLAERYAAQADPKVTWLDLHDRFLTDRQTWKPHLTLDGTHLSQAGYDTLAQALAPHLK